MSMCKVTFIAPLNYGPNICTRKYLQPHTYIQYVNKAYGIYDKRPSLHWRGRGNCNINKRKPENVPYSYTPAPHPSFPPPKKKLNPSILLFISYPSTTPKAPPQQPKRCLLPRCAY